MRMLAGACVNVKHANHGLNKQSFQLALAYVHLGECFVSYMHVSMHHQLMLQYMHASIIPKGSVCRCVIIAICRRGILTWAYGAQLLNHCNMQTGDLDLSLWCAAAQSGLLEPRCGDELFLHQQPKASLNACARYAGWEQRCSSKMSNTPLCWHWSPELLQNMSSRLPCCWKTNI